MLLRPSGEKNRDKDCMRAGFVDLLGPVLDLRGTYYLGLNVLDHDDELLIFVSVDALVGLARKQQTSVSFPPRVGNHLRITIGRRLLDHRSL
jgi:hypothetical protein